MTGIQWRLNRIFSSDGRAVILPVDHGIALGEIAGLREPLKILSQFIELPIDGVLLTQGLYRSTNQSMWGRNGPSRILTVDSFFSDENSLAHNVIFDPMTALLEGFDAIKMIMIWDQPPHMQAALIKHITKTIVKAHKLNVPVMVEPVLNNKDSVPLLNNAVRIAFEIGADILKVPYPDSLETLNHWTTSYPVPFLILGGHAITSPDAIVDMVGKALKAGVAGVTMGRNIWNRPDPEGLQLMKAIISLVHGS
ncbi:MAG: hypothetical protein C7B43_15525 [Sulfobacillus benefaciens]|jgi:DhnA family fructose-bisphosphate aldolase class Ia|uniref:Deoxyribose-phosphate aldolase n=1 Tax=Sulfobacillus benefaciens TaxID=453960 RepID=A0A2T2WUP9_9FIRM|nr:MAG: hypothetical protein C7B43_15525 [Sulfobacillus benefaciens]HBQ93824.1 hypothetical protein [Sulfobacillus sp.]